jgi:hypothetical protein
MIWSKPAFTGARKRKPQINKMLQTPAERDFVVRNWFSRDIYTRLLSHKLTAAAVQRLTIAQRHAKIYGYERSQQFEKRVVSSVQSRL